MENTLTQEEQIYTITHEITVDQLNQRPEIFKTATSLFKHGVFIALFSCFLYLNYQSGDVILSELYKGLTFVLILLYLRNLKQPTTKS